MRSLPLLILLILLPTCSLAQNGAWARVGTHKSPPLAQRIIAGPDRIVYFVDSKGIVYVSTDGCANWSILGGVAGSERITDFWVSPTGYLMGKSDTAFYWTRDGDYWTFLPHYDTLLRHHTVDCAAIDNNGTPYFGISYHGIYRLNDDAQAFTRFDSGLTFARIKDMEFDRANRLYTLGDSVFRFNANLVIERKWAHRADFGDKLYRAGTGMLVIGDSIRTLEPTFEATAKNEWGSYVVDSSGALVIINGNQIGKSTDFGRTWQSIGPNPVDYGDKLAATKSGLIVQRPSEAISISIDSEKTFAEQQAFNDQLTFNAIFVDRQGTIHAFDTIDGHWLSKDGGQYWSLIKQTRSYPIYPGVPLFTGSDGTIYLPISHVVGTMNFRELVASTDNGATFHRLPHPTIPGAVNYNVFPVESGDLYSYSDTHILSYSTNNGATWTDMGDFLDSNNAFITQNPDQIIGFAKVGPVLWAASESQLYYTTNSGAFWQTQPAPPVGEGVSLGTFQSLWSARDRSIFLSMRDHGYHWLSLKQHFSLDSWIQCYGPMVQVDDSDVVAVDTYRSSPFYLDEFVQIHRGHALIDTLVRGPDSLSIRGMARDSAGNIFGIGYPAPITYGDSHRRGIYKFYPTGAGVHHAALPSSAIEVAVAHNRMQVISDEPISEVRIVNVLGDVIARQSLPEVQEWRSDRLYSGLYILEIRTSKSSTIRKILVP